MAAEFKEISAGLISLGGSSNFALKFFRVTYICARTSNSLQRLHLLRFIGHRSE